MYNTCVCAWLSAWQWQGHFSYKTGSVWRAYGVLGAQNAWSQARRQPHLLPGGDPCKLDRAEVRLVPECERSPPLPDLELVQHLKRDGGGPAEAELLLVRVGDPLSVTA